MAKNKNQSYVGLSREHYAYFTERLHFGISQTAIVQELNKKGFHLTVDTFRTTLHRVKKEFSMDIPTRELNQNKETVALFSEFFSTSLSSRACFGRDGDCVGFYVDRLPETLKDSSGKIKILTYASSLKTETYVFSIVSEMWEANISGVKILIVKVNDVQKEDKSLLSIYPQLRSIYESINNTKHMAISNIKTYKRVIAVEPEHFPEA